MQILPSFSPSDVMGIAFSEFNERQYLYQVWQSWYDGTALDKTRAISATKNVAVYPLHLNPIHNVVHKHNQALFGAFDDSSDVLVFPQVVRGNDVDEDAADQLEAALLKILSDNQSQSVYLENGLLSQIFGGCIFRAGWDLGEKRVTIERIHPNEFWCIPYHNNPWKLKKAWLVREISEEDALVYGAKANQARYWYIEEWTETYYTISVNDKPALIQYESDNLVVDKRPNPWNVVPFVYIPHVRSGKFLGESLVTVALQQLVKEINARLVDIGDAVAEDAHSTLAIRNTKKTPEFTTIGGRLRVVDLGNSNSISGSENDPDLFSVNRDSLGPDMLQLVRNLHEEFMRESFVPAVAYGEDEGSQRSSATLTARMYPLVSHAKTERAFWNAGLNALYKIIIIICSEKGVLGLTTKHLELRLKNRWFPVLPRDRKELTDELVARAGAHLGSIEQLLGLFGDVENVDEVLDQIKEFLEFEANLKSKSTPVAEGMNPEKEEEPSKPKEKGDDDPPKGVSN